MVTKKKVATKKRVGKLKLKKVTIRDLDAMGKSGAVKGGVRRNRMVDGTV